MRRRDFFGLAIGTAALGWPRPSLSQQSGKLPVIAFLGGATPAMWTAAFVDRLKALGWIDGQTVKLEDPNASLHLLKSLRGLIQAWSLAAQMTWRR